MVKNSSNRNFISTDKPLLRQQKGKTHKILMDNYTKDTMHWLDTRYRLTSNEGIYFAHSPIYGFRKGHSESNITGRYIIAYQIMKSLSHLQFNSLLDVGGSEGYKAALIRSIFNVKVQSCDLSNEACNRAKEIFNIDGVPADIHRLPYGDNEFDVVLCSETLEHVPNYMEATRELIRVCKKAVIITVPHEQKIDVKKNLREKIPHAHIHSFDIRSFDFCFPIVSKIIPRKMHSSSLRIPLAFVEAEKMQKTRWPQIIKNIFNSLVPVFKVIFGKRATCFLIKLDDLFPNSKASCSGIIFLILKNQECYSKKEQRKISVSQVIDFKVPYHYINFAIDDYS